MEIKAKVVFFSERNTELANNYADIKEELDSLQHQLTLYKKALRKQLKTPLKCVMGCVLKDKDCGSDECIELHLGGGDE
jgi:hypothetical protein